MSDKKSILDTRLAKWIQLFLAVIGVAWGFYGILYRRVPKLVYEIQSQTDIFNKSEELSSVHLVVDTVDVLKTNQNISVVNIKVQNIGNQSLRTVDYDDGLFGLVLQGGTILKEVTISESCNQHIIDRYKELTPTTSKDFMEIPKLALDEDEWYTISIAVLHNNNTKPVFEPVGKIIGQREISVVNASSEKISFGKQLFYGGWLVNGIRLLISFVIVVIIVSLIAGFVVSISEGVDKRKKERVKHKIISDPEIASFVRDDYLLNEDFFIRIAEHYYSLGEKRTNNAFKRASLFISDLENLKSQNYDKYRSVYMDINRLIEKGYLIVDDHGQISTIRAIKESINKVIDILQKEKYESYRGRFHADIFNDIEFGDDETPTLDS